jgi:hypothetical protein
MGKIIKLAVVSAVLVLSPSVNAQETKSKEIVVDMYFEPFDAQGWQNYLNFDLIRKKTSGIKLNMFPLIIKDNGKWISSHGDVEVKEVARIEGIIKKYPQKLNDYLIARSLYMSFEGWKDSLIYAQINPLEFENYVKQNRSMLLDEAYSRLSSKNISGISIFINGAPYKGNNNMMGVISAINPLLAENKRFNLYPDEMQKFKNPKFIAVSDANTKDWVNPNVEDIFKRFFTSLDVSVTDISKLDTADRAKLKMLPAYLIEKNELVDEALSSAIEQNVFDKVGNYYVYYDQNSKSMLLGAKKESNKLDIFVMSHCPFGVMAENSIIDAVSKGLISKNIALNIHYIGDALKGTDGKINFRSLHGDDEWQEDARQLLIKKFYPDKLFSYLKERNKNYTSGDWKETANKVGIDTKTIDDNFETTGKKLLEDDFNYTNSLNINRSPTLVVNGNMLAIGLGQLKSFDDYKAIDAGGQADSNAGCGQK